MKTFVTVLAMQLLDVVADVFRHPPIPYEPAKHTLKAWAKYCLQNRGFKVVYADNADFAIETRDRETIHFNVSLGETPPANRIQGATAKANWILWNEATQSACVLPPMT